MLKIRVSSALLIYLFPFCHFPILVSSCRTTFCRASVHLPLPVCLGSLTCEYSHFLTWCASRFLQNSHVFSLCPGTRRTRNFEESTHECTCQNNGNKICLTISANEAQRGLFLNMSCSSTSFSCISENLSLETIKAFAFSDLPELAEMWVQQTVSFDILDFFCVSVELTNCFFQRDNQIQTPEIHSSRCFQEHREPSPSVSALRLCLFFLFFKLIVSSK